MKNFRCCRADIESSMIKTSVSDPSNLSIANKENVLPERKSIGESIIRRSKSSADKIVLGERGRKKSGDRSFGSSLTRVNFDF